MFRLDRIPDPTPGPRIADPRERLLEATRPLLAVLTPRERRLLLRRVIDGERLKALGAECGVGESTMSYLMSDILTRLRRRADELGGPREVRAAILG